MTVLPAFEQAGQSFCVPGMALIQLEINQPQVFTASVMNYKSSVMARMEEVV